MLWEETMKAKQFIFMLVLFLLFSYNLSAYYVSVNLSHPYFSDALIYVNGTYSGFSTPHSFYMESGTSAVYSVQIDSTYFWDPHEFEVNNISNDMALNFEGYQYLILSSFCAEANSNHTVSLTWVSLQEKYLLGYDILRTVDDYNVNNAIQINQNIIPATNTLQEQTYTFIDSNVLPNQTYYYWLKATEVSGEFSLSYGPISATLTRLSDSEIPEKVIMKNAYPNPIQLNTNAKIDLNLKSNETGKLTIYNTRGQVVQTYNVNPKVKQIIWDAKDCVSGVYFYQLKTQSANITKKIVILK